MELGPIPRASDLQLKCYIKPGLQTKMNPQSSERSQIILRANLFPVCSSAHKIVAFPVREIGKSGAPQKLPHPCIVNIHARSCHENVTVMQFRAYVGKVCCTVRIGALDNNDCWHATACTRQPVTCRPSCR